MPFHIHGSQMNGSSPPPPYPSHLSLLLSLPSPTPIFTLFRPASLNYCHGQATTLGGGEGGGGVVGRVRRRKGGGDVYMDVMRGGDAGWHAGARYMFTGVSVCVCVGMHGCFCACAFVHLRDVPMGQLLVTHPGCCSNSNVTTVVWHLGKMNVFHLEKIYWPPQVLLKTKGETKDKNMTPAPITVSSLYVHLCFLYIHMSSIILTTNILTTIYWALPSFLLATPLLLTSRMQFLL